MAKVTIPAIETKAGKGDDFLVDAEYAFFGTAGQKTELEITTQIANWFRQQLTDHIRQKCARREEEVIRQKKYFAADI